MKTIAVDFDGVIHSYTSGWKGATNIPDDPVPGALEWLYRISLHVEVVIFSTRAKSEEGKGAIQLWLEKHWPVKAMHPTFEITAEKPPAILYVDDRGFCFTGSNFPSPEYIAEFKPWNKDGSA